MEIPFALIQFGVSLLAIFALAGLAYWLKLGGKPSLSSEDDVARAAGEVEAGFVPVHTAISRKGDAALAKDANGRIMLIKRHGNQFAGRVLISSARVREVVDAIEVDPRETQFGAVRLSVEKPGYWADAINRL
ncbi:MAG: hypothetical protein ABJP34_02025 [Erythrobacter sp.]